MYLPAGTCTRTDHATGPAPVPDTIITVKMVGVVDYTQPQQAEWAVCVTKRENVDFVLVKLARKLG